MEENKKPKLALMDLDGIGYIISYDSAKERTDNPGIAFEWDKLNEITIKAHAKEFIKNILKEVDCDYYLGFVENGKLPNKMSFRRNIYPEYKGNRDKIAGFKYWLPIISDFLVKEFNIHEISNEIESDDAVSIMYNRLKHKYDITIVHNDKDLKQIAMHSDNGIKYFNYKKFQFEYITREEGFIIYYNQIIKGDPNDNIKGIPGAGPKYASEFVEKEINKFKSVLTTGGLLGIILNDYIQQFQLKIPTTTLNAIAKEKHLSKPTKELTEKYSYLFNTSFHEILDYFCLQVKLITLLDRTDEEILPNLAPIEYIKNKIITDIELLDI